MAAVQRPVVGVQPSEDGAGRTLEPLVDGVRLPAIGLTHPVRKVVRVALQDIERPVGASAVEHEQFEVRIALIQD